jgi:hypothetical protein
MTKPAASTRSIVIEREMPTRRKESGVPLLKVR